MGDEKAWVEPSITGRILSFIRLGCFMCLLFQGGAAVAEGTDEYISGYAAALVEHGFNLPGTEIQVDHGVVTVYVKRLGAERSG